MLSQETESRPFSDLRAITAITVLIAAAGAMILWQQNSGDSGNVSMAGVTSEIAEPAPEPKVSGAVRTGPDAQPAVPAVEETRRIEIAGPDNIVSAPDRQGEAPAAPGAGKPVMEIVAPVAKIIVPAAKIIVPAAEIVAPAAKIIVPAAPVAAGKPAPPSVIVVSPAELAKLKPTVKRIAKPDYVIQLSALKSVSSARSEAGRLKRSLGGLLKGKRLHVQKAAVRGRGIVYRVHLAGFSNRGGADRLCARIKARSFNCLVRKR